MIVVVMQVNRAARGAESAVGERNARESKGRRRRTPESAVSVANACRVDRNWVERRTMLFCYGEVLSFSGEIFQ